MIRFEKTHFEFNLKERETKILLYTADQEIIGVTRIKTSCGCSKATVVNGNQVRVVFTAQPIPKHLLHQGYYNSSKSIDVFYNDSTKQRLTFTAKISN